MELKILSKVKTLSCDIDLRLSYPGTSSLRQITALFSESGHLKKVCKKSLFNDIINCTISINEQKL